MSSEKKVLKVINTNGKFDAYVISFKIKIVN